MAKIPCCDDSDVLNEVGEMREVQKEPMIEVRKLPEGWGTEVLVDGPGKEWLPEGWEPTKHKMNPQVEPEPVVETPAGVKRFRRPPFELQEDKIPSALDRQVGGSHYKGFKIQPWTFFQVNEIPFHKATIIKRILRYDLPTGKGKEDLDKIRHELDLIEEHWDRK